MIIIVLEFRFSFVIGIRVNRNSEFGDLHIFHLADEHGPLTASYSAGFVGNSDESVHGTEQ